MFGTALLSRGQGREQVEYLSCRWLHEDPMFPILLYSELDEARWETRKVEIWADGHKGYASAEEQFGDTFLGQVVVPSLDEIAASPEFLPEAITADEFERIWHDRAR